MLRKGKQESKDFKVAKNKDVTVKGKVDVLYSTEEKSLRQRDDQVGPVYGLHVIGIQTNLFAKPGKDAKGANQLQCHT